jgi:hypothetical protein
MWLSQFYKYAVNLAYLLKSGFFFKKKISFLIRFSTLDAVVEVHVSFYFSLYKIIIKIFYKYLENIFFIHILLLFIYNYIIKLIEVIKYI